MSLFVISDLHLSTLASTNKSMEVFGHRWQDYMLRLKSNWEKLITDSDTVVIPGDISWALSLEESVSDLKFVDALPGKKILGKGNHDFWWCTMNKHRQLFEREKISSISFLFNNAHETEDYIIAGTRGWYHDEEMKGAHTNTDFEKLVTRESIRLTASLKEAVALREKAPEKEILVFMHFPPFWQQKESEPLMQILLDYGINRVYFGHIHGNYSSPSEFTHRGVRMSLTSADYLSFIPKLVPKEQ